MINITTVNYMCIHACYYTSMRTYGDYINNIPIEYVGNFYTCVEIPYFCRERTNFKVRVMLRYKIAIITLINYYYYYYYSMMILRN